MGVSATRACLSTNDPGISASTPPIYTADAMRHRCKSLPSPSVRASRSVSAAVAADDLSSGTSGETAMRRVVKSHRLF